MSFPPDTGPSRRASMCKICWSISRADDLERSFDGMRFLLLLQAARKAAKRSLADTVKTRTRGGQANVDDVLDAEVRFCWTTAEDLL
jgi:hypothetical protein